jgi:calcium-dependent protein kinase
LAPEIVYEHYNEKVDIWAIGVTMYHLLSGRIPFKGDNLQAIMQSIVKDEVIF